MARRIPIEWVVEDGEYFPIWVIDIVDKPVNSSLMTCGNLSAGMGPQSMVDQTPKYDSRLRQRQRKRRRIHQVMGKSGIIRPDKRMKAKYL